MRRPATARVRVLALSTAVVAALAVVTLATPARAERAPFPTWQASQRVYFSGTPELPALAPGLAQLQQGSDVQLIVVVVDIADRGGVGRSGDGYSNAAGHYGDDLYEHWVEGGALNAGLDGKRHVLITHALDNRSIGVHWGSEWQALGYSEASGVGLIDRSDFFDDPVDRVFRSLPGILGSVYDGPAADRTGHQVRDFHRDIKGVRPDGRRYHAHDRIGAARH